jgi:hypothetical protein
MKVLTVATVVENAKEAMVASIMGSGGFSVWWESGSSRRQDVFTYDLLYNDIL